jgi:hypothetical protein
MRLYAVNYAKLVDRSRGRICLGLKMRLGMPLISTYMCTAELGTYKGDGGRGIVWWEEKGRKNPEEDITATG